MSALDVWGLDDVAETAYRAMLRNPDLDLDQLARHLELEPAVGRAPPSTSCVRVGLVSRAGPGCPPASPATTLAALVHVELSDLEERRSRLDAVRGQPVRLRRRPHGRAVPRLVQHAVRAAQRGRVVRRRRGPPARYDGRGAVLPPGRRHRRGRTDVRRAHRAPARRRPPDARALPDRGARRPGPPRLRPPVVRRRRDGAAAVRVAAGDRGVRPEAALVSAGWGGDAGSTGHLLVRAPALVALVRELFEQYWARGLRRCRRTRRRATPTTSGRSSSCCSSGLKDETHRPPARGLAADRPAAGRDLMDELGATTRFQAGMEAARRGLV